MNNDRRDKTQVRDLHTNVYYWIMIGLLVVIIIAALIANYTFSGIQKIVLDYIKSDNFEKFGGYFSGIGTVFLGIVALIQNHLISKQSRRLNEPILDITDIDFRLENRNEIYFMLRNVSDNIARNVLIKNAAIVVGLSAVNVLTQKKMKIENEYTYLLHSFEEIEVILILPPNQTSYDTLQFNVYCTLKYTDKIGRTHSKFIKAEYDNIWSIVKD